MPGVECDADKGDDDRALLLARFEATIWGGEWESPLFWRALSALRFAPRILSIVDDAVRQRGVECGSLRYCLQPLSADATSTTTCDDRFHVAVHWRAGDFLVAHRRTTPDADRLAAQLRSLLDSSSTTAAARTPCLFLMTNADRDNVASLRRALGDAASDVYALVDRSADPASASAAHGPLEPTLLAAQMELARRAHRFVGTEFSTVCLLFKLNVFDAKLFFFRQNQVSILIGKWRASERKDETLLQHLQP